MQESQNALESCDASPGLYVHVPFCLSRCGYCTFVSGVYDIAVADAYLGALKRELQTRNCFSPERPPSSVFIGGGTPSCLSLFQLETLLSMLPLPAAGEITCEVNPDSCSREMLAVLRGYGVNRISFGVQTFDKAGLKLLQRRHDADTAKRMVALALESGFESVNVDLMNGWPGQTISGVEKDLSIACDLGIQHISNYTLILESGAAEYADYVRLLGGEEVDEERAKRSWDFIEEFLETNGFKHYETSNFSKPGHACRHNCMIWRGGEYLGLGLGACSHLDGVRRKNITDINTYIQCSDSESGIVEYEERLEGAAKARECAVFWLRLFEGIALEEYRLRTGFDFHALYAEELPWMLAEGILEAEPGVIRVSRAYQPVLDAVLEHLV